MSSLVDRILHEPVSPEFGLTRVDATPGIDSSLMRLCRTCKRLDVTDIRRED